MLPVSVIIPVLDEARAIESSLAPLQDSRGPGLEVIVVDGGSRDGTRELAAPLADRVIEAQRGRASQMNAGAAVATGDALLFLHADTRLPAGALAAVRAALEGGAQWGRFDVSIEGRDPLLRVVAWSMNLRSRASGIATGDQAMFMRREAFDSSGGFPAIPLMEDIALSRALKRRGRPACLALKATTSGRRWERDGTLRTIALMWRLRAAYALGADAHALARRYEAHRAH